MASFVEEPDYIFVIKIIAAIEPTINDLIALGMAQPTGGLDGRTTKEMFGPVAEFATKLPLGGGTGRLELALRLGMISGDDVKFAVAIGSIRNRYAHNIRNSARTVKEMYLEAAKDDANFGLKLTYGILSPEEDIPAGLLKLFIGWAFLEFLDNAERRHLPTGGLFGLLGVGERSAH